ncbi:solute carrier family 28 member 3-like [Ptychodera flava]|uniref:solute carrier family 28 member 3-like n=1 Tax=Ptychodera flava TaxID=63121 RepID=UPI00396A46F7
MSALNTSVKSTEHPDESLKEMTHSPSNGVDGDDVKIQVQNEINSHYSIGTKLYDEENESPTETKTGISKKIGEWINASYRWSERHSDVIKLTVYGTLVLCFCAYFIYACWYDFNNALALFIFTSLALAYFIYAIIRDRCGDVIWRKCMAPCGEWLSKYWYIIKWPTFICLVVALIVFLVYQARDYPPQLMSAVGACVFLAFGFVASKYPDEISWRAVFWGVGLQFILAVFILRTYFGYKLFEWIGDFMAVFLSFSDHGAEFVFGEDFRDHYFAFVILPVIIYFASFISIAYYTGSMQWVILKIAWLFEVTMATTASESVNAAGNIFIGMTEAPLLIKPFLDHMTLSELNAVMVGGFATIAGSVLAAYIAFGVSASHLVSASVISAPAALGIAKLFYPETSRATVIKREEIGKIIGNPPERNMIEAAANGACQAVTVVGYIAANLIAFVSLIALLNAFLGWVGMMVGIPNLSFELICSYVFMPVAFLIGIEWADCRYVAGLIGTKLFINEFVAYEKLSELITNRENGVEPYMSVRSEVISTYILCGFDNIGSVGMMLGGLSALAPGRTKDLASIATRALVAGTVTCFMTGCVAGMLYTDWDIADQSNEGINTTNFVVYGSVTS